MMQKRSYFSENSAVFYKTRERFGELSNMASGFPIKFGDIITVPNSESLYQMLRYTDYPEIQFEIANTNSGMAAKMKSKKYISLTRQDWRRKRVVAMRWCVAMKYISNSVSFGSAILSTGNLDIVERSKKDDFWGAKDEGGILIGHNILGRLLMELREDLNKGMKVKPYVPDLSDAKLFGIGLATLISPRSSGEESPKVSSPLFEFN